MTTTPTSGAADLPEALRLAECFSDNTSIVGAARVAAELRRLHSENETLHAQVAALTQPAPSAVATRICNTCQGTGIAKGLHNWIGGGTREQKCWNCHEAPQPTPTAQAVAPAEPAGAGYAELPEDAYRVHAEGLRMFDAAQMRDFADRTHALRASHGQAPAWAARQIGVIRFDKHKHPYAILETCADDQGNAWVDGSPIYATPSPQAAPLEFTKEWCMAAAKAEEESGADISAGVPVSPQAAQQAPAGAALRSMIEGMSVSVDVSTGDHDAGHRYFGTVTEVMECQGDKHGVTLLVQDAEPNFTAAPAAPPTPQAADTGADTFTPYGSVTTHSVTGQQFFYAKGESPYLDNASECVTVYAKEKHPRQSDQDTAQVAGHDTGGTSSTGGAGSDQHHQHRAGEPVTQRAASERDSRSTGLHGSRDVSQEVTAQAPAQGAGITRIPLPDGAELSFEPYTIGSPRTLWRLRRGGAHIRWLNDFESTFVNAALAAAPQPAPPADSQQAQAYSLDADPQGIRAIVADAITGALAFGAQGTNQPPSGHWLAPFWEAAKADSVLEDAARLDWLQHNGATVEVTPGKPSYDWRFRVAGLHATTRNNIREAIDAARKQGGAHD